MCEDKPEYRNIVPMNSYISLMNECSNDLNRVDQRYSHLNRICFKWIPVVRNKGCSLRSMRLGGGSNFLFSTLFDILGLFFILIIISQGVKAADSSMNVSMMTGDLDYQDYEILPVWNTSMENPVVISHDVDLDGVDDFIIGTETGTILGIDPVTGSRKMKIDLPDIWISGMVVGNVDDDEGLEILVRGNRLTCVDLESQSVSWSIEVIPSVIGLVTNNSNPWNDIVFEMNGTVYRVDGDGAEVFSLPLPGDDTARRRNKEFCFGDIDDDGRTEFVITTRAYSIVGHYIWIIDVDRGRLEAFQEFNTTFCTPPVLLSYKSSVYIGIGLERVSWRPFDLLLINGISHDSEYISASQEFESVGWRYISYWEGTDTIVVLYSSRTDMLAWSPRDGTIWEFTHENIWGESRGQIASTPEIADIDNDGDAEILIIEREILIMNLFDGTKELHTTYTRGQGSHETIILGDYDGDGYLEVGASFYEYIIDNTTQIIVVDTPPLSITMGPGSILRGTTLYPTFTYHLVVVINNMSEERTPVTPMFVSIINPTNNIVTNISIQLIEGIINISDASLFRIGNDGGIIEDGKTIITIVLVPTWEHPTDSYFNIGISLTDRLGINRTAQFNDHFKVERDLVMVGLPKIRSPRDIDVNEDWVRPGDELSISALWIVFEGSDDIVPPSDSYLVSITVDDITLNHTQTVAGENITYGLPNPISKPSMTIKIFQVPLDSFSHSIHVQRLMLDLLPPRILDHYPMNNSWSSSQDISVGIRITDDHSGVDLSKLRYRFPDEDWIEVPATSVETEEANISIILSRSFNEGVTQMDWSIIDMVGNPFIFHQIVKVDITGIRFTEFQPTDWQRSQVVNCSARVTDSNGSGVDGSSIEYSYSNTDVFGFSPWASCTPEANGKSIMVDFEYAGLENGTNMIRMRGRDLAGNEAISSEIYYVLIDTTPPLLTVEGPSPGSMINPNETSISVTIEEVGSGLEGIVPILKDRESGSEIETSFSRMDVKKGMSNIIVEWNHPHFFDLEFLLTCTDIAGNSGSIEPLTFSVNRPPEVEIVSPLDGAELEKGMEVLFSALVEDPEGTKLMICWLLDDSTILGDDQTLTNNSIPAGTHTVIVSVNDGFYNVTATSEFRVIPRDVEGGIDGRYVIILLVAATVVSTVIYIYRRSIPDGTGERD